MGQQYGKNPDLTVPTNAAVPQSTTDQAAVTAAAGVKQRILKVVISGPTTTGVTINSKGAGAGTAILGPLYYTGNTTVVLENKDENGWAISNAGEGLTITTTSGGTSSVQLVTVPVIQPPP